jgi:hypothetical protein
MTATLRVNGDVAPWGDAHDLLPTTLERPLAASEQIGKGQLATINPDTGYARLNDGSVPNQIGAGVGVISETSNTSATAGGAKAWFGQQAFKRIAQSTTSLDYFTDADFWQPCYIASENTIGKLSYTGTRGTTLVNRSLCGMFMGIDPTTGLANVWVGPIAWEVARSAARNAQVLTASLFKGIDAGAAADTVAVQGGATLTEAIVPRGKQHGKISAIDFVVEGTTLALDATHYGILNIYKRDGAGGAGVLIATADGRTAFTQFTAHAFTLVTTAGYVDLIDGDVLTLTRTHAGNGSIIPAGYVRIFERIG